MATDSTAFKNWPKGVVGTLARDKTDRPQMLRLKATGFTGSKNVKQLKAK